MKPPEPRLLPVDTETGVVLLPCIVRRVRGSRHLRVVVEPDRKVHLRIPYHTAEREALEFLRKQGDWVVRTLAKTPAPLRIHEYLRKHPRLSADGQWWDLRIQVTAQSTQQGWRFVDEPRGVEFLLPQENLAEEGTYFGAYLRSFAKLSLPHRLHRLARERGVPFPKRVTVRDQRSRWGSCSTSGTISLNWRLVLLAPALQDYILLHELAHIRHPDHSAGFWRHLQELDPAAMAHDREIQKIGTRLISLGV